MVYEAILLFGVVFAAGFVVLAVLGWTYPLPATRRWTLQAIVFVVIGAYFVWCWTRTGQTLALKTWRLRVIGPDARPPSIGRAALRYLLAWSLFAPGLIALAIWPLGGYAALGVLLAGFLLMLVPAWLDADRRLLHDRWSATRLVHAASGR